MAELEFVVSVDSNGFAKVNKLKNEFNQVDKSAKTAGKSVDVFGSSMKALAPILGAGTLLKLGKDAIFAQSQLEDLELQFRPLLGSAEEAKKRIQELSEFASRTPFQLPEIAKASKVLETLTNGVLSTGNGLRLVGDSASVAGVGFEELAVHVGRAFSNLQANRGAGESLARLQELGLLSGEVRNQIEDLQKAAKGKEAWEVLQSELKKTEGAMDGLSETFSGKLSTLGDNFQMFMAGIARESGAFDVLKRGLDDVIESFTWWNNLLTNDETDELTQRTNEYNKALVKLDELKAKSKDDGIASFLRSDEEKKRIEEAIVSQERLIKGYEIQISSLKRVAEEKRISDEADKKAKEDAKIREQQLAENKKQRAKEVAELTKLKQQEELQGFEDYLKGVETLQAEHDERERERLETYFATIEENDRVLREMQYSQFDLERMAIQEDYDLKMQILANNEEEKLKLRQIYSDRMTSVAQRETDAYVALEEEKQRSYIETARIQTISFANITEAGEVLFKKSKALAIANAVMQAGVASMNAMATQPFFPLGLSMFGLAVANGIDAVRKIQGASYVQGGVVDGGEQFIRINERGSSRPESILNSRATAYLGRQGVEMLNNGRFDVLEKQGGGNTINVNVNGVLSRDVYENEIKPLMNEDMSYR